MILRSSFDVCSFKIRWEIYCFWSHSYSLRSIDSICSLKWLRKSYKNFAFRAFSVEINSSKYFSERCSTASAFSSSDSLACRISSSTDSVLSNLSKPSLAALLILPLRSFAPSYILETGWPRWPSNIRQEGQIMLNPLKCTSSTGCNSTRRLYCAEYIHQYQEALMLRELRPWSYILFVEKKRIYKEVPQMQYK